MDMVAAISNKRSVKQLTATLSSYPAPVLGVQVINHLLTPPASPRRLASSSSSSWSSKGRAAEALLESLQKQISATMAAIELVQRRQAILAEVTARAATLVSATPQVHGDDTSGGGSKKSRKGGGGGGDMGPCGWEPKLVWDDDEVRAWTGGRAHPAQLNGGDDDREGQKHEAEQAQPNGDGQDGADQGQPEPQPAQSESEVEVDEACLKIKRRCDRHSGWQKIVNAALELEERTLERRLQGLQDERDGVSRSLELDKAAQATRWVMDVHLLSYVAANGFAGHSSARSSRRRW
jgi:COMPASS component SPP1